MVFCSYIYISLSIIIGISVSLNSVKVNPNIYSYISIIMFLNAFVPSKRFVTSAIISFYHIIFVATLSLTFSDNNIVKVLQINTTVCVILSMVILFTFHQFREKEFANEKSLLEKESNMSKPAIN